MIRVSGGSMKIVLEEGVGNRIELDNGWYSVFTYNYFRGCFSSFENAKAMYYSNL